MRIDNFRGQSYWKVMPQKIDVIDKKIAYLLCKNARLSNTAIAKALKLKREVVSYRIKKMHEKEFLNGFVARINPRKLGFLVHFVYLKLKTPAFEKELIEELMGMNEITNLKNIGGRFDVQIETMTKGMGEFNSILQSILNKYGKMIQEYYILHQIEEEHTNVDLLLEENKKELDRLKEIKELKGSSFQKELEKQKIDKQNKNSEIIALDELDIKILHLIMLNARINLKEIAEEVKSSFAVVQKRIKRLVEEGIITTFTAFFSFAHLDLQMYPVLLHLQNVDENKLRTFVQDHPHILWAYKLVGNWNYQINIYAKNNPHFHDVLNDFREAFAENVVAFDSIMVFNTFKIEQRAE